MNYKELKKDFGDNPKVNDLLIALIEQSIRQQAQIDALIRSHTYLVSVVEKTDLAKDNRDIDEKILKSYNELKAECASFIL